MRYANEIMKARVFMGYPCQGGHKCASCGVEDRADINYRKAVKTNFCNYNELLIDGGVWLCESCVSIMDDSDMRFKPVLFEEYGQKVIPEREDILTILESPPKQYVLSLPYSFKKHHWLYAGLSTDKLALIGTDNRTVPLDYTAFDIPFAINETRRLISGGIPRGEIISGRYSIFSEVKCPSIHESEQILSKLRPCGALELFVKYTPAVQNKIVFEEDMPMLSESEGKAVEILCSIAERSNVRSNDGIRFWGGFYERRINRYKQLPLHEFTSKVAESVSSGPDFNSRAIVALTEAEEMQIMQDIRDKTTLIIALAYSTLKESWKK